MEIVIRLSVDLYPPAPFTTWVSTNSYKCWPYIQWVGEEKSRTTPVSDLSAKWFVEPVPGMEEKGRNTFFETSASSAGGQYTFLIHEDQNECT